MLQASKRNKRHVVGLVFLCVPNQPQIRALWIIDMKGSKIFKALIALLIGCIAFVIWSLDRCSFSEEYATDFLSKKLKQWDLKPEYLGSPLLIDEQCSCNFMYECEGKKIHYIFSKWGDIHFWDYANGSGP